MRFYVFFILISVALLTHAVDQPSPYQTEKEFAPLGKIDELLLNNWRKNNITPAKMSSDAVFLRRIYIDLIGTVPTSDETRKFLADKSPDKRSKLIDQLLERKEFAQYWSLKWCDILRVKSEFPINLWPNAVQAYNHWVWEAVNSNMPYDQFARKLLTSSGSNFRDPPVNFYRATQDKTPAGLARIAALTFMGTRLENWPEKDRKEFEKLFSRVGKKITHEWKEEIIYLKPDPAEPMTVAMPDGITLKISPDQDPRTAFADWLIRRDNPWFTEAAVNRVWYWFFNRGIVQEPDDFKPATGAGEKTNTGNAPVNPELLAFLAQEFSESGYDFKKLCRLITNSAAYQQSCIPTADPEKAEKCFAVYPVHRLDAEVLIDTLNELGEFDASYMSVIPEPFTFIPPELRTITLADGSISSPFLETFGRPARDTGRLMERNNQTTYSQRLFMLNSPTVQWKVSTTPKLRDILKDSKGNSKKIVDDIYLLVLSRYATDDEFQTIIKTYKDIFPNEPIEENTKDRKKGKDREGKKDKKTQKFNKQNAQDVYRMASGLVWTLVNTKEFMFKH